MQGRSGTCKNCVTCVSQNGGFRKKKFKPGVSQNTGYFIWLICFDPSNSKATSCSKAVTRQLQGNELLAYDCHQLTLFPRRITVCLLDFGSFISIEVCRDCIPALASSCKKQLMGFFVCLLFILKVKRIS